MFLKRMYANGFKSFAEKTEVVVEKGITAIVGPNGSGKSNISDAIKWVLGEQSAKSLRGGKMEDIIFAGTEKRMALGYADVNLIFDNEDGGLPIEYKEVSIRRKLFKTGESEYYINKQPCRLKDIKELFMDTGIGRDGYSVIGQGRVEDILSPNSDIRRGVFEEAAGIVKYKARKEEAIKKLEKTNDNIDRVNDIVHELHERINPLMQQSEKAQKFVTLKNELRKYELNYFVREYERHKEQLTVLENQRVQTNAQKQEMVRERDYLETVISDEKEKIVALEKAIAELEVLQSQKNKEYEEAINITKVQNERYTLYSANVDSINKEIDEIKLRNQELESITDSINTGKNLLIQNLKKETQKYESLNSEIQSYKEQIDSLMKTIDTKRNDLFEVHKTINKLNSSKSTYESFIRNDEERIEQLSAEIEAEIKDKNSKQEIIDLLNKEQEESKIYLSNKKQEYNAVVNIHNQSQEKKQINEKEIRTAESELSKVKSKLSVLSNMEAYYDGYYKSVQTLMNNKAKNPMLNTAVLGTVAEVIKTKKEYETAIEIALGSAIQNVIVNSDKDAENIIEYLKSNKIGRITFLPLNMIQEKTLNQREIAVLADKCVIDTADKLVDTDAAFQKVIKHLLGRTLIVDNITNGFRVSKSLGNTMRIVSLQGDVINPGGSVTGGHISNNQNLLGRKREIEECKENSIKYTDILNEKNQEANKLLNQIKQYAENAEQIKTDISDRNSVANTTEAKISMLKEQRDKTDSIIKKYTGEREFMIAEKNKRIVELNSVDEDTSAKRQQILALEKEIDVIAANNDEKKKTFEEYNASLMREYDGLSVMKHEIGLKDEKISNINIEISRNNEAFTQKQEALETAQTEIKAASELINSYNKSKDLLKVQLNEVNREVLGNKNSLSSVQKKIYEYQNTINSTNKKITSILDDENSMNVKIEREKSKTEDISSKLWEEYEMNYAMALPYKDESISFNKIYNDVNNYKKAIKDLGDVNVNAIDEYKEVKQRYDFLTEQKNDLSDAKLQLGDVIKELEAKMQDKFLEEFASIRLQFNEVFKKLFNGGKADVYLEDETDALNSSIEIAVQPPGKKLSKISLLSGGEKSLTAIALLFAILKTKPTPFCILDEIEAALDDVNIYRFTQYLREFSKETQFLVITHRKGTMESADTLYGTTMEEKGVTKLVSMKLSDVEIEV